MINSNVLPKNEIKEVSNLKEPINPFVFLPVKECNNDYAYQNEDLTICYKDSNYICTLSWHHFSSGGMENITTVHQLPKLKKDNVPVIK